MEEHHPYRLIRVTTLLPFGGNYYDIYKMVVSSNDEVTFNALRMSDGKKVIGKIDSSEVLTIIDEQLDTEVVVLERIN